MTLESVYGISGDAIDGKNLQPIQCSVSVSFHFQASVLICCTWGCVLKNVEWDIVRQVKKTNTSRIKKNCNTI